jgi:hypothetical protein
MCSCRCSGLRETTHWIELRGGTRNPLCLSYTIVNSSLGVILLRSRSIESSLIIILWLSLIDHWTIIHESFFRDHSRVEAPGDREELIDDRSRHDHWLLSCCFDMAAPLVIIVILTTRRAIMRIAFLNHRAIHFFLELIRNCLSRMIAVVVSFID